jgi:hypothetical protein
MEIKDAATAAEFVAAWTGPDICPIRARGAIAAALDGMREVNAIQRTYPSRYDQSGVLAAIAVFERALSQMGTAALAAGVYTTDVWYPNLVKLVLLESDVAGKAPGSWSPTGGGLMLTTTVSPSGAASLTLRCQLEDGRFVMRGGAFGEHSLSADPAITTAARLVAHWTGYVQNNAQPRRAVTAICPGVVRS